MIKIEVAVIERSKRVKSIEIYNLSKKYKKKYVLDSLNLLIEQGKIYGIIGKNGAGKTTLLKIICGLVKKNSGIVKINGSMNGQRMISKIGACIENPALYPHLTAKENLEVQRKLIGIKEKNASEEILRLVGLENNNLKTEQFSLGMKQRLAIGLAMMGNPAILLLDEPFNGLDPVVMQELIETLDMLKKRNVTIVISSHMLESLLEVSDVIEVMKAGKIIEEINTNQNEDLKEHLIRILKEG